MRAEAPSSTKPAAGHGLERYLHLLPIIDQEGWRSLGEGGTPLLQSSRQVWGGDGRVLLKPETQNPTFSFKDRYVSVTLNAARAFGYRKTVVSSTGNLGVSAAAYAAACGLECEFIAPDDAPSGVLDEARGFGASIRLVDKARRFAAFEEATRQPGWFPLGLFLRRSVQNPFGIESYRTFAYEIIESLGEAPDFVLFPCARGNGLYGAWKGFLDAREWGWTDKLPRLVACQPEGANSLEVSIAAGATSAMELPPTRSIARSICETAAADTALEALRASGGLALSAPDAEIVDALWRLASSGLNVEASAAIVIACLPKLAARTPIDRGATIVCVLTGPGFRWLEGAELARRLRPRQEDAASARALA